MMLFTSILSLALLITSSMVLATTLPNDVSSGKRTSTDLPYPVDLTHFTGALDGQNIDFNGSVQGLVSYVLNIKPDFDFTSAAGTNAAVDTRAADNKAQLNCCPIKPWSWVGADIGTIMDNVNYLNRLTVLCGVPARTCVRVACSYNAAIYLCNDNYYGITPNCRYIASYATDLVNRCRKAGSSPFEDATACGQEFDTDSYNVIIRRDRC